MIAPIGLPSRRTSVMLRLIIPTNRVTHRGISEASLEMHGADRCNIQVLPRGDRVAWYRWIG